MRPSPRQACSVVPRFIADFEQLSAADQGRFKHAVAKFIEDLEHGRGFRRSLRVKGIRAAPGIFEMTWAPDGRATFEYGPGGEHGPHIRWRRVGTHEVVARP